jgi:hypothetical protein
MSEKSRELQSLKTLDTSAPEGLASERLDFDVWIEGRAQVQERRVVPQTVVRFHQEAAAHVPMSLREDPPSFGVPKA